MKANPRPVIAIEVFLERADPQQGLLGVSSESPTSTASDPSNSSSRPSIRSAEPVQADETLLAAAAKLEKLQQLQQLQEKAEEEEQASNGV